MTITEQHPTTGNGPSPVILCEPLDPSQVSALAQRAATRVRNPITTEAPIAPWVTPAPAIVNPKKGASGALRVLVVGGLLLVAAFAYLAMSRSGPGPTLVDVAPTTAIPTTVAVEPPTTSAPAPETSTPAEQPTPAPTTPSTVATPGPTAPPVTQAPEVTAPPVQSPPTTNKKAAAPTTATPTTAAPTSNGNGNGNGGGGNSGGNNKKAK